MTLLNVEILIKLPVEFKFNQIISLINLQKETSNSPIFDNQYYPSSQQNSETLELPQQLPSALPLLGSPNQYNVQHHFSISNDPRCVSLFQILLIFHIHSIIMKRRILI